MIMHMYRAAQIVPWSLRAMYKFFIFYWEFPFFAFQIKMADFFPKPSAKCCLSQRLACYIALLYPLSLKPNGFNFKMSLCISEQWKNEQWKCSAPR